MSPRGRHDAARAARGAHRFSVAAAIVFVVLMAVAVLAAVRTEVGIDSSRSADRQVTRLQQARYLFQRQDALTRYGPLVQPAARLALVRQQTDAVLAQLRADPRSRATAGRLGSLYGRFLSAGNRYRAAGRSSDASRVAVVERALVGCADELIDAANGAVDQAEVGADANFHSLDEKQEGLLVDLPIAFLVAGALLFFLARAARRILEEERQSRRAAELFEGLAMSEPLTGLGNYRAFAQEARAALSGERGAPPCLVMIGLGSPSGGRGASGLRSANDRLRDVADALRRVAADAGSVFRVSDRGFAALLAGPGAAAGVSWAERLGDLLGEAEGFEIRVGVAAGEDVTRVDELVRRAELAMRAAVSRDSLVAVYSPDLE